MFIKNRKLKLISYSTSIFIFLFLLISLYSFKKVNATCTVSSDIFIKTTNPPSPDSCYNQSDGSWGIWHSKLGNFQTVPFGTLKKCETSVGSDYGYCYHYFHCDSSCSEVIPGDTSIPPDPVLFGWVRGYVWSDDNKDNTPQTGEFWSGDDLSCLVDKTKINDFTLDRHKYTDFDGVEDLILPDYWTCDTAPGVTTKVPIYTAWREDFSQAPRWHGFRLLDSPTSVDSWAYLSYFNSGQIGRDVKGSGSWAGNPICSPTPACYEIALFSNNRNWLSFKMYGIPANEFKLRVTTYVTSGNTDTCNTGNLAPSGDSNSTSGIQVKLCKSDGTACKYQYIKGGTATWNTLSVGTYGGDVLITTTGTSKILNGGLYDYYQPSCPLNKVRSLGATPGSSKYINIGVKLKDKSAWISSIDADIFANSIGVPFAGTAVETNGFKTFLINSDETNANVGGFVFSQNQISDPAAAYIFEKGGKAINLSPNEDSLTHKSKWLTNFGFLPPNSSIVATITSLPTTINAGTVYQISPGDFRTWMNGSGNYTYTIGTGVAVLYIGDDDVPIEIKKSFTSTSAPSAASLGYWGRLVVVSKNTLVVGSSIGFAVTSNYKIDAVPKVDASIIANNIEFSTVTDVIPAGSDMPIMMLAPLVSKENIIFGRDLGSISNARLPAESAKFYGRYLYEITRLEREKSQDYLYYTGLTTFDLDFVY